MPPPFKAPVLTPARPPLSSGSLRERRPGVWEIRISTGTDPVTGTSRQRSFTVHGTRSDAERRRDELVIEHLEARLPPAGHLRVDELLDAWLAADHPWKPSTLVRYRSNVRAMLADPIAGARVAALTPHQVRTVFRRWYSEGATLSVVGGRFRVLRSAVGWAYDERILDVHPLRTMRGPTRPEPRRPIAEQDVRALLATASTHLLEALANDTGTPATTGRRHRAELDHLLVRLAADTGARRGELTALRIDDLHGRTLHIHQAISGGVLTTPKSGHARTMTVGLTTAALWHRLVTDWEHRAGHPVGPWLFTADLAHQQRLGPEVLGHRFANLREAAGVPDATLHRLRHSVATFLVSRGEILQAQARLGHADAATTLREYAYALPLTDESVADALDRHLEQRPDPAESTQRQQ